MSARVVGSPAVGPSTRRDADQALTRLLLPVRYAAALGQTLDRQRADRRDRIDHLPLCWRKCPDLPLLRGKRSIPWGRSGPYRSDPDPRAGAGQAGGQTIDRFRGVTARKARDSMIVRRLRYRG